MPGRDLPAGARVRLDDGRVGTVQPRPERLEIEEAGEICEVEVLPRAVFVRLDGARRNLVVDIGSITPR